MTAINSLTLDSQLSRAGPAAETFAGLWQTLWRQTYIKPEELELCRLTFARLHADEEELAAPNAFAPVLSAPRRQAVLAGKALESADFTPSEKAILLFSEYYWLDPQSITDEAADHVKKYYGEPGLVFLIESLGVIDGRIRTARVLRDLKTAKS
jgi:hypothetical protein